MKTWNPYPLVRLFLPFAAGILIAIFSGCSFRIPLFVFVIMLLLSGTYVFFLARKISYRTRWIYGWSFYLMIVCCGYELTLSRTAALENNHFIHLKQPASYTLVRITAPPQLREKSIKAEAEMMMNGDSSGMKPVSGQLMLYLATDSASSLLEYGDLILIQKVPEVVAAPANPGAFDYQHYLAMRGVYHQAFVRNGDWRFIGKGSRSALFTLAYDIRSHILGILSDNGITGREFAVTSALLIGYTDKLDPELLSDYSGTGAIHILSVSGMHVGLIYAGLNLLLFFFDKIRYGKYPKALLLLLCIWVYALVTGLSPCVLRAALMFSLIVTGKLFSRNAEIFNTLAASAMILLIINPYYITDMGFQLTYMAVIGIVAIQPSIQAWWTPRWWILQQGWSITTVSIAAQILTFPMGMYYFQQFPNYFLITNFVALPLSTAIIYLALVVLAVSFIPSVSVLLSKVLSWMVIALNSSIGWIEQLPGSVSRGVYVTGFEALLIYGMVISVLLFLYKKNKVAIFAALTMAIALCSSLLMAQWRIQNQASLVVYQTGKSRTVDFIRARERLLLADSMIICNERKIDFYTGGLMDRKGVRDFNGLCTDANVASSLHAGLYKYHSFAQFLDQRIAWVNCKETSLQKLNVDFLILTNNARLTITDLLATYQPEYIIIDATNSKIRAGKWVRECEEYGIPCWSVPEQGAFVWDAKM